MGEVGRFLSDLIMLIWLGVGEFYLGFLEQTLNFGFSMLSDVSINF